LYLIKYRRHGKTYQQLCCNLDYGPASWTGKSVDIGYGAAGRLAFNGVGHISITKVGKLPRSKWRKFKNYTTLEECKEKLKF
jgi:hypothetical protein